MVTLERISRNKDTQEFFTPKKYVLEMINEVPAEYFKDLVQFRETTCGNGNICVEVIEKYKEHHNLENIVNVMQLADYQEDNCIETIKRILGDNPIVEAIEPTADYITNGLIKMFKVNGELVKWMVQADSTTFNWWELSKEEKQLENLSIEVNSNIQKQIKEQKEELTTEESFNKFF